MLRRLLVATGSFAVTLEVVGVAVAVTDILVLGHTDPKFGDRWANFRLAVGIVHLLVIGSTLGFCAIALLTRRVLLKLSLGRVVAYGSLAACIAFAIHISDLGRQLAGLFEIHNRSSLVVMAGAPGLLGAVVAIFLARWQAWRRRVA